MNRMTLDGRMTHHPLPGDRRYRPVAVAADGTVWYSRPEQHIIGRIACS